MKRKNSIYIIHDAAAATGINGKVIDISDADHIKLQVSTSGSTTATIKVYGAITETAPDFTSAASISNEYSPLELVNNADQTDIKTGDTGIAYTGTDSVQNFAVNVDNFKWLVINITAYTQGNINTKLLLTTLQ